MKRNLRGVTVFVLLALLIPAAGYGADIPVRKDNKGRFVNPKTGQPMTPAEYAEMQRRDQLSAMQDKMDKSRQPSVQVVPHPVTAIEPPGGTSAVVDNRPPIVPADNNHICPAGYYCVASAGGFLVNCHLGSGVGDCNYVARFCRHEPVLGGPDSSERDKYCE